MRNKSHQQLGVERSKQIAEIEHDLNKAYDSSDFIDLENTSDENMDVKIADEANSMRQFYSTDCILKV